MGDCLNDCFHSCLSFNCLTSDFYDIITFNDIHSLCRKQNKEAIYKKIRLQPWLIDARDSLYKVGDNNDVYYGNMTPLMYSSTGRNRVINPYQTNPSGDIDIVNFLLDTGADINAVDNIGFSALHYACTNALKNEVIILTLLEKNADINIFNNFGESPLTLVVKNCFNNKDSLNKNERIIETLLIVGSRVNNPHKYNAHLSAFDIAYNQGLHNICLLLINYGAIFPQRIRHLAFSDNVNQQELIDAYNIYHKQLEEKRELHRLDKELKLKENTEEIENTSATNLDELDISFEIDIL